MLPLSRKVKEPRLSVIIPSYNDRANLLGCLASLNRQKTRVPFEVIVVNSSDREADRRALDAFPGVTLIELEKRTYPGVARNRGVQGARGDLLVFTDCDCLVSSDWVDSILRSHAEHRGAVIGGAILNGTPWNMVGTAEYLLEFGDFLPERKGGPRKILPTCNLSLGKQVFEKVGKFDNMIKGSDTLFSFRAFQMGLEVKFDPDIQVIHRNRRSWKKSMLNQIELGYGSCLARKKARLPGTFLVNKPGLAAFILPVRIMTTLRKLFSSHIKYIIPFFLTFPVLVSGLLFYVRGFYRGIDWKRTF